MIKQFLSGNQIIIPSYQYYGGFNGFQDYGINGLKIKNQLQLCWRQFFISNDINEVETPSIMPFEVLKTSGHVDKFYDYVVYDKDGISHRADHLVKKWCNDNNLSNIADKVDSMNLVELQELIIKYKMIDVEKVTVECKNLMISTSANEKGSFLRPELAQGIFVNFNSYLSYLQDNSNANFKPFGIAQIGKSYRREISPIPFTRMLEFTQAEIEYFVDPLHKTHQYYGLYCDTIIPILSESMQMANIFHCTKISAKDAVQTGVINSELMAYFLAKIYLFAVKIGLQSDKIRFRQHLQNEKAHYALQCWDLECLVGENWLECVGCADRGSYDLTKHSARSPSQPLAAKRTIPSQVVNLVVVYPNIKYWKDDKVKYIGYVKEYFKSQSNSELQNFIEKLEFHKQVFLHFDINNTPHFNFDSSNNSMICTLEMFTINKSSKNITSEVFTPHVVEPSFGIDRLIYAMISQNLYRRPIDENRLVLNIPAIVCPYDVAVFALHKKDELCHMANKCIDLLALSGYKVFVDDSSVNIGKKYVRSDELGVRYAVTIDFESLKSGKVTIRNRNTMVQELIHHIEIVEYLKFHKDDIFTI